MKRTAGIFILVMFFSFAAYAEEPFEKDGASSEEVIAVISGVNLAAAAASLDSIDGNIVEIMGIIERLDIEEITKSLFLFKQAHKDCLRIKEEIEQSRNDCSGRTLCVIPRSLAQTIVDIFSKVSFVEEQKEYWKLFLHQHEQEREGEREIA